MDTKHLLIKGRVQGVGYRYSMLHKANELGLKGWVRNRRDGAVEAIVQGEKSGVDAIVKWAHQGPSLAHVDDVLVSEAAGEFHEFSIEETV